MWNWPIQSIVLVPARSSGYTTTSLSPTGIQEGTPFLTVLRHIAIHACGDAHMIVASSSLQQQAAQPSTPRHISTGTTAWCWFKWIKFVSWLNNSLPKPSPSRGFSHQRGFFLNTGTLRCTPSIGIRVFSCNNKVQASSVQITNHYIIDNIIFLVRETWNVMWLLNLTRTQAISPPKAIGCVPACLCVLLTHDGRYKVPVMCLHKFSECVKTCAKLKIITAISTSDIRSTLAHW